MEQSTLQNQLTQLGENLHLTPYEIETEPYVLTQKEEQEAIRNAIEAEKNKLRWNVSLKTFEGEIEAKIKNTDWSKKIDRDSILKTANKNKNRILWEQEQRKLEKVEEIKKAAELIKRCDANYFFNLMKRTCINIYGKQFEQDEDNRGLIKLICFFLSRDERFETELKFDGDKGLLIRGISGLGKTFLFECVKNNELNPVKIISIIKILEEVKDEGVYKMDSGNEKIIYLDDVGTEEDSVINYYGTKINWFKDFIETQYEHKNTFKNIIISTNISFDEIEKRYGYRVRSRFKEIFNVVNVTGKDRRK